MNSELARRARAQAVRYAVALASSGTLGIVLMPFCRCSRLAGPRACLDNLDNALGQIPGESRRPRRTFCA